METRRKIISGNFFNSLSKDGITVGSDFEITEPDGKSYFYRYRVTGSEEITVLDSTDMFTESNTEWDDLPLSVREKHFSIIFPDYELISFSKEKALKFIQEIGEFQAIRRIRSSLKSNNEKLFVYIFDEKKRVSITVKGKTFTYQIEDNDSVMYERKSYGLRIRHLCNIANVPWDIGILIGHIESDETALEILNKIKSSRKKVSEENRNELLCGNIDRMRIASMHILGKDTWKLLAIGGRKKVVSLTTYLAGVTN